MHFPEHTLETEERLRTNSNRSNRVSPFANVAGRLAFKRQNNMKDKFKNTLLKEKVRSRWFRDVFFFDLNKIFN